MLRPYGLRSRLLAALVLTSAVTLGVAALALFGPLQDQLREESAQSFRAAVLAARPGIEADLAADLAGRDAEYRNTANLAERTGSRVLVYTGVPVERYPSDIDPTEQVGLDVLRVLRARNTAVTVSEQ